MEAIDTFTPRDRALGEMKVKGVVGGEGWWLAKRWKGPTVMEAIDTFAPRDRAVGEAVGRL